METQLFIISGLEREIHVETNFTYAIDQPGFLKNVSKSRKDSDVALIVFLSLSSSSLQR